MIWRLLSKFWNDKLKERIAMATKNVKTRITMKHDTEENWLKAENFVPLDGEVIVYDADTENPHPRLKIGNGSTVVNNLPFSVNYTSVISITEINEICEANIVPGEEVSL